MIALSPLDRGDRGAPRVVLSQSSLGFGEGHPEGAHGEAPFLITDGDVNNPVNNRVFGHFSNKDLATHTLPPSLAESPQGNDTYVAAPEQWATAFFVPVKFQLKSPQLNDFGGLPPLHEKSPPNRIRLIGAAA